MPNYKLPESCLICLPALTTLCLDRVELQGTLSSFSLPVTSLSMKRCNFSETVWGFVALSNLHLDIDVLHTKKKSDCFSGLDNLRNLTLNFSTRIITSFFISCPELVNLKIIAPCTTRTSEIVVVAPKLREVYCVSIFEVTLSAHELENVILKLRDANYELNLATKSGNKFIYSRLIPMFSKLGCAKILTIECNGKN
ncbi:hypothetical protein POM88_002533 [Heracleum sosnowskyi]|uniref:Uncharacterized protein n=1 Tax=Heracleum sosnowskyi TaxID=360622 RepID=A0AAD8JGW8_9APIA|nr:hypothetical protein POM88_002533 [Heracleum sosnowskyi]